jgi:hypothetical protein
MPDAPDPVAALGACDISLTGIDRPFGMIGDGGERTIAFKVHFG